MLQPLLFITIFITAILQALLFPWLDFFGSPMPLVIIYLTFISFKKVDLLIWLGLIVGIGLDLVGISFLGAWAIFYLAICQALRWLLEQPNQRWWWRVAWAGGTLIIAPLYAQLLTGQLQLGYWPQLLLLPALLIAAIVALPCWLLTREHRS